MVLSATKTVLLTTIFLLLFLLRSMLGTVPSIFSVDPLVKASGGNPSWTPSWEIKNLLEGHFYLFNEYGCYHKPNGGLNSQLSSKKVGFETIIKRCKMDERTFLRNAEG